jgi:hypothetical protein
VVVAEPVPAVLPVPEAAPDLIAKHAEIVVKP